MLTANDIRNAAFNRSARGYKISEVDQLLEEVISTLEQLHNENSELVHKLEVLADRIQEYRNEEDSIRSALLTAQKSADKILKEANDEKERILADAHQQADDSVRLAQEKAVAIVNETREKVAAVLTDTKAKSDKMVADATEQSARMVAEATEKSKNMLTDAVDGCRAEKEYLEFLKETENTFRQQLMEMYRNHFEFLKKGPEAVRKMEQTVASRPEPVTVVQEERPEEAVAVPEESFVVEDATAEETVAFAEPEEIPLPFAVSEPQEESDDDQEESPAIDNGFEVKRKFTDLKFGEDYDISSDDDYDDYGV